MQKFFQILVVAVLLIVLLALVILGIGFGLDYIMQYISCELLLYIETGLLFAMVLVIALFISKKIQ